MPTTIPAIVPTGVPPPFEGATVTVAGDDDVGCGDFNPDDAGVVVVVEDAVDELALPAVLGGAVAEDAVVEAPLMLK